MIAGVLISALLLLAIYVGSHRLGGLQLAAVVGGAALGAAIVVSPALAQRAALALGVSRGTDLILYLALVSGMFVTANLYFRHMRQEQILGNVIRELAILEAQRDTAPPKTGPKAKV